ncbi:MAG: GH92 family glycosyl hydrolase [Bacteroidales bacterium]|nr:GH92 family glycosyl hydrolase [Bacteroidales bacterium]
MRTSKFFLLAFLPVLTVAQDFTQYVDPHIGTGDHGHVFVGANIPFGMINAGPTQLETGWDWCSGYHEKGTKIVGFAQTHLSGTGCSDLGDVAIMPITGDVEYSREGLATLYCHDNEEVRPGYYSILLGTDKKVAETEANKFIHTEITANQRNAIYRITYPKGARVNDLIVDLNNGVGDILRYARLTMMSDRLCVGFRISHGWANDQHCYFSMRFSRPVKISDVAQQSYYRLSFEPSDEPLLVTIALSPVSEINAMQNMIPEDVTFNQMRTDADNAWNRELRRVKATFQNDRDRRIFYTAMYHFMVAPQTWDDANGDWRGANNHVYRSGTSDKKEENADSPIGTSRYLTTLSLWDTYRAAAPLSTIILPEMMPAVVETYLRIFREQHKLPVWHLMSQETNCMVGCPAVPVLADLLLKGYVRDTTLAWQAMEQSLLMDERGLDDMKKWGYVANDHHGGSLSMSLEYMLADWSAAEAGKAILSAKGDHPGIRRTTDYLHERSLGYKHLYDPRVGFLRSKNSHGEFNGIGDFNPAHQTKDYTEGNPWQYLWLVPHDVEGLVNMLGGREEAVKRLDALFAADSQLNAEANPDITGLIGQYAHGNEPSHHTAYLYALMGEPRKTARLIHQIQNELYTDQPAGLCGNEDVGQMSAWYILSALGFYQVEPCGGRYVLGSPLVKEATLHVGHGKTFTIRTHGLSAKAFYIKRALLNGQPLGSKNEPLILRHEDIMRGGTLDIYMSK